MPGSNLDVPLCTLLYQATVDIGDRQDLGTSPLGQRYLIPILGGTFEGEGLKGTVLPGGADRQLLRADGCKLLDAEYEMRTDDGVTLSIRNRVLIDDNPPQPRYARSVVDITAPAGTYAWLSRKILIGTLRSLQPERQAVLITVYTLA
ncbi:MAG TPA: DUF3237 domain-containing protein [Burkholderiaceae bacterium]|nr:DUF3237 domain-containing protein [Burkholderiaceae bacterium]